MTKKTRRLGRGLDSLISNLQPLDNKMELKLSTDSEITSSISSQDIEGDITATMLDPGLLTSNPFQPRSNINTDLIVSMAESIRHSGIIQPITVRKISGRHEIIAGERRWRAALHLGMKSIPVMIRKASDEQMLELALIENIHREDLSSVDRAKAYERFCSTFSLSAQEIARRLGEDRTTVVNYLRLLQLPPEIQKSLESGELTMGHARCLLGVTDEVRRLELSRAVIKNQLSVRALEETVRRERPGRIPSDPHGTELELEKRDAHRKDMERRFEQACKTKVTIQAGKKRGSGRIVIEYYSLDDFSRIAATLGVEQEV